LTQLTQIVPQTEPITGRLESADEIKKMIRKLRWIGMGKEAERMCARLARLSSLDTTMASPPETD